MYSNTAFAASLRANVTIQSQKPGTLSVWSRIMALVGNMCQNPQKTVRF
jgi:hypothetical protein